MDADSLAEDDDAFAAQFQGQLSFEDQQGDSINSMLRDPSSQSLGLPYEENGKSVRHGPANVAFEVVNAQIVKEPRSKYVLYSISMVTSPGMDKTPITVTRRYSHLDALNTQLKKRYPVLLRNVSFPKKQVTGNFKAETVAQRSRAFEQYLAHLYSIDEIRLSKEFGEFFYEDDLVKAYEHIPNGQYEPAIPLLQNVVSIEKKILGCNHTHVILTLCALAACHDALDRDKPAQMMAEAALCCIGEDDKHPSLIPLLNLSIRLCWKLGKNKVDLESRLQRLRDEGFQVNGGPSLLQLVVRRFQAELHR